MMSGHEAVAVARLLFLAAYGDDPQVAELFENMADEAAAVGTLVDHEPDRL